MSISRGFLLIGTLYLLIGILFGMYMGGSGNHAFAPLHAHMNLLGFTLMTLFGIVYRVFPEMAGGLLAKFHFWAHQVGVLVLMVMLFLLFSGRITEAQMPPVSPIAEMLVFLGILSFAWNLYTKAK